MTRPQLFDHTQRDTAAKLQQKAADHWVVMWGTGSQLYWAFLSGHPEPLVLSHRDIDELKQEMHTALLQRTRRTPAVHPHDRLPDPEPPPRAGSPETPGVSGPLAQPRRLCGPDNGLPG
ncbi:hypothetical protein HNR23_002190 [Nocardiopsis mwathae]|uniref:Uncharacterized protein n=1 Tax=Nocardiopsis mwathae TaxID=1472723 RepID=A0A7X0D5E5_9ACTN|nr:hypothetical protein [Nocardiopsis mwathae]MBB6172130.1 hypothetical protein [Nocardiopsis mwathae]